MARSDSAEQLALFPSHEDLIDLGAIKVAIHHPTQTATVRQGPTVLARVEQGVFLPLGDWRRIDDPDRQKVYQAIRRRLGAFKVLP